MSSSSCIGFTFYKSYLQNYSEQLGCDPAHERLKLRFYFRMHNNITLLVSADISLKGLADTNISTDVYNWYTGCSFWPYIHCKYLPYVQVSLWSSRLDQQTYASWSCALCSSYSRSISLQKGAYSLCGRSKLLPQAKESKFLSFCSKVRVQRWRETQTVEYLIYRLWQIPTFTWS